MKRAFRGSVHLAAAVLVYGCENDVSVHLLPEPPAEPPAGGGPMVDMPVEEPPVEEPPIEEPPVEEPPVPPECVDGDPCSGLKRALYFHGPYDRVEIPSSPLLDLPQDFAVEAWVLPKSYTGGHGLVNRWASGVGDFNLTFGVPEALPPLQLPTTELAPSHGLASWSFLPGAGTWVSVVAPSQPSTGTWHHIAISYGAGSYRLYVDGLLSASASATDAVANPPSSLFIGATARNERNYDVSQGQLWWPPLDGFVADVRLSSTDRYPAEFEPEPELVADETTIALWHLDEGDGALAADSGPNELGGTITGAQWALAPERDATD